MKADRTSRAVLVSCALAATLPAVADEKEELLKLRNTTLNLIELLVQQGVLDKRKAEQMIQQAERKAAAEAKAQAEQEARAAAAGREAAKPGTAAPGGKGGPPVRVTYVPEFIKEEIRQEVAKDLEAKVTKQVKAQAKQEKWGIPAALPEWVSRFKPYGDIRLRFEDQFFGDNNRPNTYPNWPLINAKGGITRVDNPWLNTTHDRDRFRLRLRLGLEYEIADSLRAAVRLTTSNDFSPISLNQTLGQYGTGYQVQLDRAFLQYDYLDPHGHDWITAWGGRIPNPWFSTDNMFDQDLNFEGFATTLRMPFGDETPELKAYQAIKTAGQQQLNMGYTKPNEVYLTLGYFPLQEITLSAHDKYLWAAQGGLDWLFTGHSRIKLGLGYYHYNNTQARRNFLGSTEYDWTAPQFFTQGNSLARISNDLDPANEPRLVGLASKFHIFDAVLLYDYTAFAPNHLMLVGNYSHNFGFDQAQILRALGENIAPRTDAFEVRFQVGHPEIARPGDWNAWVAYKYLDRDSVLDAFTDSNFHLGGTNAKGWVIYGNYAFAHNLWLNLRWFSASVISGPTYDVNLLQADLNARF
ncbi:putative porin [Candidatus Methylocalor cossyra]|uniref:Outer membrane receptor for ferric coprogen and ferric-rhodotorulic acid n=1 Tax=Candidatus Methylocalor cossyra TaxID=3108543 RepID=A0ABP1C667_9GAMM